MPSQEHIAQLMEMGFTLEKATTALANSNDDVAQALAYLFNDGPADESIEPLAGHAPETAHQNPFVDNIKVQEDATDSFVSDFATSSKHDNNDDSSINPDPSKIELKRAESTENPPNLPQRSAPFQDSKDIGDYLDQDLKSRLSSYLDNNETPEDTADVESFPVSEYNIFDDCTKFSRPDFLPPVLFDLPIKAANAYFAPLLMIFAGVSSFRSAVFEHHYEDYGYTENWYKGDKLPDQQPDFIKEMQKLLGFLDGDSGRFFASIQNFLDSLPDILIEELQRADTLDEFLSTFYTFFVETLGSDSELGDESRLDSLFDCKFNVKGQSEQRTSCFSIEFSHIRANMYQSLHDIIVGENMERAGSIDIYQFSDIITIPILAPEDAYNVTTSQGMSIPESFYPQIFSQEHSHVYRDIRASISDLLSERQNITKQKQTLTSFRGQKVDDAAKASLEALRNRIATLTMEDKSNDDRDTQLASLQCAAQDLERFIKTMREKQEGLRERWLSLNQRADSFDLTEELHARLHDSVEAYVLIGAVFSEREFFYLTKNRDDTSEGEQQWIRVQYMAKNFHLGASSFEEVQTTILNSTGNPSRFTNAIVLIYCKSSSWQKKATTLPEGLREFLKKDYAYLEETTNVVESTSLLSISQDEEDEVDSYSEDSKRDIEDEDMMGNSKENVDPDEKGDSLISL